jgi:hypothetical protein
MDSLDKRPKLRKMHMRLGTWNVRSLYRAGLLIIVVKEISKYKSELVGVNKVRWDSGGTETAREYPLFMERGKRIMI